MDWFPDAPEDSLLYLIWAQERDRTNRSQFEKTEAAIRQILGPGACLEEMLIEKHIVPKLAFWFAALNASQVELIKQLEGVSFMPPRHNHRQCGVSWMFIDCDKGCRSQSERTD